MKHFLFGIAKIVAIAALIPFAVAYLVIKSIMVLGGAPNEVSPKALKLFVFMFGEN